MRKPTPEVMLTVSAVSNHGHTVTVVPVGPVLVCDPAFVNVSGGITDPKLLPPEIVSEETPFSSTVKLIHHGAPVVVKKTNVFELICVAAMSAGNAAGAVFALSASVVEFFVTVTTNA